MLPQTTSSIRAAIAELHTEKRKVDGAIAQLQTILGDVSRHGTKNDAVVERALSVAKSPKRTRRKAHWSPAMRAAARARMKKFWAGRRATK